MYKRQELERYPAPAEADTPGGGNTGNNGHIFDNKNNNVTNVTNVTKGCPSDTDDPDFEERAAILEFDAGLNRENAETTAAEELNIPPFLRRVAS